MSAIKILTETSRVLEEFGWRKGDYGNCKEGFCLLGALNHAALGYDSFFPEAQFAVRDVLWSRGHMGSISMYNDDPDTKLGDIHDLIADTLDRLES